MFPFFRLGGLARSQISARIGARQSNRRGNLSRGVFPYFARWGAFCDRPGGELTLVQCFKTSGMLPMESTALAEQWAPLSIRTTEDLE